MTGAARPVTPAGILAQSLSSLLDEAEAQALDAGFVARLRAADVLAGGLDPYLEQCATPESEALRRLSSRTRATDWSRQDGSGPFLEQEMLSGHVEGQVLKFLVRATGATRVLEIGMFTGYSALAMAEALPDDGELVACELDATVARFAQDCFDESPDGGKITVRVGPALETLQDLRSRGAEFDLVFVDADKGGYVEYLRVLLDGQLLAPRGVICVDNTLMQGQPWGAGEATANGAAIAHFNRVLAADDRVEQVLVPLRDGLTLIRRTEPPR